MRIEDTEEYKQWAHELDTLNRIINNLPVWDGYAERLQQEYDWLLDADPRLKK